MNTTIELRWTNCGHAQEGTWALAWAQLIGMHHASISEDHIAHRSVVLPQMGHTVGKAIVACVNDGVGGGSRGDIASAELSAHCLHTAPELWGQATGLAQWMRQADAHVQAKLAQVSYSPGAATSVAAWLLPGGRGHIMRVGDCRAYRCTPTGVQQITFDQTYAAVHETPPQGASPSDPARQVGAGFMGVPELMPFSLGKAEQLLLCSDGLHRALSTIQIGQIMQNSATPTEAARALCSAALHGGSQDDISVLLIGQTSPLRQRIAVVRKYLQKWIA